MRVVRGVAIGSVLIWHFFVMPHVLHPSGPKPAGLMPTAGVLSLTWAGVDLFFVLSGLLIAGVLLDRKGSPFFLQGFYLRRFFRIYPMYWVVMALCFVVPFLAATPVLFIMGAAFVYYVMLPFAIRFFASYQTPGGGGALGIELQAKVSEYLDFVTTLIFAFGLCFQLPVLLSLLGRVGIVSSAQLRGVRRYAILGIVALSAVVTPPDVFSMISLALPLIVLYEISIWCVRLIENSRAREDAARAAAQPL